MTNEEAVDREFNLFGVCRSQMATDLLASMLQGTFSRGLPDTPDRPDKIIDLAAAAVTLTDELIKQLTKEN